MLLYMNLMVTTNQKRIIDTRTQKRMECKNNSKNNHQITREESKRRKKEQKRLQKQPKAINRIAIHRYLSVITLNVNGLNATIKRQSG